MDDNIIVPEVGVMKSSGCLVYGGKGHWGGAESLAESLRFALRSLGRRSFKNVRPLRFALRSLD